MRLTVSIVTFQSDPGQFQGTLQSLLDALHYQHQLLPGFSCQLHIVENDVKAQGNLKQLEQLLQQMAPEPYIDIVSSASISNLGYGRGHNQAINVAKSDYHLVLNPDVLLEEDALSVALGYLEEHPEVALASPSATDPMGTPLYLCKRYPALFDLLLRGLPTGFLRQRFAARLARYEMHDLVQANQRATGLSIVSGCCMLFRTKVLQSVGGFDDSYFLYFEDFDLSLRIAAVANISYLPEMQIVHYGGHAARKGVRHIALFMASGVKFFRQHGWRWI